jgi:transcriptional regulator with XRE-family HTH domain
MSDGWYSETRATFGDRLIAAREAAGLSAADLARRLGVADKTVRAWEDDQSEPRANRLQMLAGLLNISLMWLMTGNGPGLAEPGDESGPAGAPVADPVAVAAMRAEVRALRGLIRQVDERVGRLDRRIAALSEAK